MTIQFCIADLASFTRKNQEHTRLDCVMENIYNFFFLMNVTNTLSSIYIYA